MFYNNLVKPWDVGRDSTCQGRSPRWRLNFGMYIYNLKCNVELSFFTVSLILLSSTCQGRSLRWRLRYIRNWNNNNQLVVWHTYIWNMYTLFFAQSNFFGEKTNLWLYRYLGQYQIMSIVFWSAYYKKFTSLVTNVTMTSPLFYIRFNLEPFLDSNISWSTDLESVVTL